MRACSTRQGHEVHAMSLQHGCHKGIAACHITSRARAKQPVTLVQQCLATFEAAIAGKALRDEALMEGCWDNSLIWCGGGFWCWCWCCGYVGGGSGCCRLVRRCV